MGYEHKFGFAGVQLWNGHDQPPGAELVRRKRGITHSSMMAEIRSTSQAARRSMVRWATIKYF